jgi:hypothetical protein
MQSTIMHLAKEEGGSRRGEEEEETKRRIAPEREKGNSMMKEEKTTLPAHSCMEWHQTYRQAWHPTNHPFSLQLLG